MLPAGCIREGPGARPEAIGAATVWPAGWPGAVGSAPHDRTNQKESPHMTRLRTWSLVVLALSALGLAGCGGSSSSPTDRPPRPPLRARPPPRRRLSHRRPPPRRSTITDPSPVGTFGVKPTVTVPPGAPPTQLEVQGPDRGHRTGGQGGRQRDGAVRRASPTRARSSSTPPGTRASPSSSPSGRVR